MRHSLMVFIKANNKHIGKNHNKHVFLYNKKGANNTYRICFKVQRNYNMYRKIIFSYLLGRTYPSSLAYRTTVYTWHDTNNDQDNIYIKNESITNYNNIYLKQRRHSLRILHILNFFGHSITSHSLSFHLHFNLTILWCSICVYIITVC